jgi:hypothetical protein
MLGTHTLIERTSNGCGIRFGSFSSNTRSRDASSSARIGTPRFFTIAAKESISWSVVDIHADSKGYGMVVEIRRLHVSTLRGRF